MKLSLAVVGAVAVASGADAFNGARVPLVHGHPHSLNKRDAEAEAEFKPLGPFVHTEVHDGDVRTVRVEMHAAGGHPKGKPCKGKASGSWLGGIFNSIFGAPDHPHRGHGHGHGHKHHEDHKHHEHHEGGAKEAKPLEKIVEDILKDVEESEKQLNYLPIFGNEGGKENENADNKDIKWTSVKWFAPGGAKGWHHEDDRLPAPGWLPVKVAPWLNKWSSAAVEEPKGDEGNGGEDNGDGDKDKDPDHDHDHDHKHKHKGDKHHDHKHHDHKHHDHDHKHKGDKHHGHKGHHGHDHKEHEHKHKHKGGFKGAFKSTKHSFGHFFAKVSGALEELCPGARYVVIGVTLLSSFLVGYGLGALIQRLFLGKSRDERRAARRQRKEARKAAKAAYKMNKAAKASKSVEAGFADESLPSYGDSETDALVERQ